MRIPTLIIAAATAAIAIPVQAEVVEADENHFITRNEAVVEADPKATWLALISPSRWWSSEHTWSADAANLTLMPQAGGCFCERIPEVQDNNRITLEGSVEHMRVIQAYPEVALRMQGALGPLQSEPVTGILTVALSEVEEGTRIVWEYNVGGSMRYPVPVISTAVDGVMTLQLTRLSEMLGQVVAPKTGARAGGPESSPETSRETSDEAAVEMDAVDPDAPVTIDPEAVIEEATEGTQAETAPAPAPEPKGPSVDDVFGDLADEGPG